MISATTGEGFDRLIAALADHAGRFLAGAESALITRERHRRALEEAQAALARARSLAPARRSAGRRTAHRRARARPADRPGRRRGHSGRDFPRLLHRQISRCRSGLGYAVTCGSRLSLSRLKRVRAPSRGGRLGAPDDVSRETFCRRCRLRMFHVKHRRDVFDPPRSSPLKRPHPGKFDGYAHSTSS